MMMMMMTIPMYTADLLQLVKRHQLIPHAYVDDTQIYGFCRPADSAELCEKVSVCIDEVRLGCSQFVRSATSGLT